MDTGTRTGISYLSNDGSDAVTAYRTSIRNVVAALESKGALASQTVLGSRPAAGAGLRFWKDSGSLGDGVLYFDNGSTWEAIGASAPSDGPAATPSLRTLGSGSTQASAGNHTHAIGAITGTGDSVTKSVGTAAGTVAAGDHTHSLMAGVQSVIKASATSRVSTTVLADDPELLLALGSAGTYRVTLLLSAGGASGSDIKVGWAFTGTSTLKFRGGMGPGVSTASVVTGSSLFSATVAALGTAASYGVDGSAASSYIREELILVVTVTGTLSMQWAQNSSGSSTQVDAGSTLIAEKIA